MDADTADSNARIAGLVTVGTGIVLLLAPDRAGRHVGLDDRRTARLVGATDLALAVGLLAARPRWPWMAARAAANLPMAAMAARSSRTAARLSAATLLAVTVSDLRVTRTLRAAGR